MKHESIEIRAQSNPSMSISVTPGHFATNHSHINYYVDITRVKHVYTLAHEAAGMMAAQYQTSVLVDTIVCLDGMEVIGALMAHKLSNPDFRSMNSGRDLSIITPEYNTSGQMLFRDNLEPMIYNKNVLLLIASVTTGKTINRSLECIQYYGGRVAGISAIFSAIGEYAGSRIHALFTAGDIPGYHTYSYKDCPDCQAGRKIDALVNSFGYSEI